LCSSKHTFLFSLQSYAGKYVPAISYKIHMENPTAKLKINFKGMAIGDGLSDPQTVSE
jgi:vitellogenic carboxypeptidase-like protein